MRKSGWDGLMPARFKIRASVNGSPPRAWGRRGRRPRGAPRHRFTPTCVGTASSSRRRDRPGPVHPHVRGDGVSVRNSPKPGAGSPPRAWGRPRMEGEQREGIRFTPTCVGTACSGRTRGAGGAVHPHVRGDGLNFYPLYSLEHGSPPRAWGRRETCAGWSCSLRFTPTCVGTACNRWSRGSVLTVHPHVRGDGARPKGMSAPVTGSPPRAWGRRDELGVGLRSYRFTPTCVGTATPPTCSPTMPSVHPHVRGDGSPAWRP